MNNFINEVKKRVYEPMKKGTASVISAPKRAQIAIRTKMKQNKMIKDYVLSKPSKMPNDYRKSDDAVAHEREEMDKNIKKKLKTKGIY